MSYGNDMLISDNPFECGFEKLVHLNSDVEFLGKNHLKKIWDKGIEKKLMGVKINSDTINYENLDSLYNNKEIIGELRSAAYSPTFKKIIGIAMLKKDYFNAKKNFSMSINNKSVDGEICHLPIV